MGAQGGDYWLVEVYAILVTHRLSTPDFSSMHATKFSFGGTMYLQYILMVPCVPCPWPGTWMLAAVLDRRTPHTRVTMQRSYTRSEA